MHFQLAIFYCKIIKLLSKLEDDLKENTTRSPYIGIPQYGGPKARTPSVHPISQSPSGIDYPKKKTGAKTNGIMFSIHLISNLLQ